MLVFVLNSTFLFFWGNSCKRILSAQHISDTGLILLSSRNFQRYELLKLFQTNAQFDTTPNF